MYVRNTISKELRNIPKMYRNLSYCP